MRIIITILLALSLSSCITQRACDRKFPPQVRVDSFYSVQEVTKYRDTTIFIYIKPDTVYKTDTVLVGSNGLVYSDTVESALNWTYASAWVYNSALSLNHVQNDTVIERLISDAVRESSKVETITKKETIIKDVPFIPWWAKVLMWLSIPTLLWIVVKAVKLFV